MNKPKKPLFSVLLCARMYADRGEWEGKRTKVCMPYLRFIRLLDRVQHHPNTVDCSHLLVGIELVYIVVAGMFSTDVMDWFVYVVWKSNLHFFMQNTICKCISKASSYKMLYLQIICNNAVFSLRFWKREGRCVTKQRGYSTFYVKKQGKESSFLIWLKNVSVQRSWEFLIKCKCV